MSDLFDDIAADMQAKFEQLGEQIVEDVRATLSVEVEYATSQELSVVEHPVYRKGSKPVRYTDVPFNVKIIRSKRGEYPRRETGRLQTGIDHSERADGDDLSLTISADMPYATYLENNLDRAFLGPAFERWVDTVQDAAASVITGE